MNLTGIIPGLQHRRHRASSACRSMLAVVAYVTFIYAGIKKHGLQLLQELARSCPGVPWSLYIRPRAARVPLDLHPAARSRSPSDSLMNMVAGHMLLVLFFAATQFFFFTVLASGNLIGLLGVGTFAFGFAFTRVRALRRRAAGLRLRHPHRHLHPARAGRRALIARPATVTPNHPRKETST